MQRPFFSIITVSYNAGEILKETAEALRKQTCGDYEHIIKDACSTDGSIDALPEDGRISLTVSKDSGIYDGMNQAISKTRGKYVFFLNCGDRFTDDRVLEDVKSFITENEKEPCIRSAPIIYGSCIHKGQRLAQPKKLTPFYLYRRTLNHQTVFYPSELFSEIGAFDPKLKIRADHEHLLRAYRSGAAFLYLNREISIYQGGGFSEKKENRQMRLSELEYIRKTHFSEKELKKFRMLEALTLSRLRKKLSSDHSPKWIKKLYRRSSNLFNK